MSAADELVRLTRERVAHLEHVRRSLEKSWTGIWKLSAFALLAIPTAFIWSCVWATVVVALDMTLMGVAAYLIGVRKSNIEGELRDAKRELKAFEAEAEAVAQAAGASPAATEPVPT